MPKEIIFICDKFLDEVKDGGAIYSLEALIDVCPYPYKKIRTEDLNFDLIEQYKDKLWIISNMTICQPKIIDFVAENVKNYIFIESDWKFCCHRSPSLHYTREAVTCNCKDTLLGQAMHKFIFNAKIIFFKSERHKSMYLDFVPEITTKPLHVVGAVFSDKDIEDILKLRHAPDIPRKDVYVILDHPLKGGQPCIDFCNKNKIAYEVIPRMLREQLWLKLRQSVGLVYLPTFEDTCSRVVITALLLDCKLFINSFVQHRDELWFNTTNLVETLIHLQTRKNYFWNIVTTFVDNDYRT